MLFVSFCFLSFYPFPILKKGNCVSILFTLPLNINVEKHQSKFVVFYVNVNNRNMAYINQTSASFLDWMVGRRGAQTESSSSSSENSLASRSAGIEKVIHEGYLEKLGSWRKNWKRRWIVLRRDSIYYYEHYSSSIETVESGGHQATSLDPFDLAMNPKQTQATINWSSSKEIKPLGEIQLCARGADGQVFLFFLFFFLKS
jgi:hypothetical protein